MMMREPLPDISVLMPVYNAGRFLDAAVRSIRLQTHRNIELIAVNDGSTDDSLQTLRRHSDEDRRIVVVDRPNGGIVDALNAGLDHCRAEFIARMDGDDVAYPQRLERQRAWMLKHPDCVAVGCQTRVVDPQGQEVSRPKRPLTSDAIEQYCLAKSGAAISHPTLFLRSAVLKRLGGYRHQYRYTEDLDLYLRLTEVGGLSNLDEVLLDYRVHAQMSSSPYNLDQTLAGIQTITDACRRRGLRHSRYIAGRLHKASWQATDLRRPVEGLVFACRAFLADPAQPRNLKIVLRSLLRGFVFPKRIAS